MSEASIKKVIQREYLKCVQSGGGTSMGGGYRRGGRIKRRR